LLRLIPSIGVPAFLGLLIFISVVVAASFLLDLGANSESYRRAKQHRLSGALVLFFVDLDEGRLSHAQLISILQEAIDNGDILLPDNEFYAVAVVFPFIDSGVLKPSQHTEAFEARMNAKASALAAQLRNQA
jgi:hypothetical protein